MSFKFIHASDLHLGRPFGTYPEDVRVRLRRARQDSIGRLAAVARDGGATHILLAGDTFDAETPQPTTIRHALNAMAADPALTWVLMPGNHDSWEDMWADSGPNTQMSNEIRVSNWQILMLNSQIPGEVGGELGSAQLALLDDCLTRASDEGLHTLVCLHHQPVAIGSAWIDAQMVADADPFFEVLER